MRRWLTVLLIVCLTFDFSLAANCIMCRDTNGAVYGLSGQTAARADHDEKVARSADKSHQKNIDDDCDCRHCQLDCALAAFAEVSVLVNGPLPGIVPSDPVFHESVLAVRLERPKWVPLT